MVFRVVFARHPALQRHAPCHEHEPHQEVERPDQGHRVPGARTSPTCLKTYCGVVFSAVLVAGGRRCRWGVLQQKVAVSVCCSLVAVHYCLQRRFPSSGVEPTVSRISGPAPPDFAWTQSPHVGGLLLWILCGRCR